MAFSILTELPAWFSFLCLLAGAFYAWLMYNKSSIKNEVPSWQWILMATSRFVLVSLLCFLLLGPMIKTLIREIEKPIIILALDESSSIVNNRDSVKLKAEYKSAIEKLQNGLKGDYEVRAYSFGDRVNEKIDFEFKGKQTDFSDLYATLDVQYANRNVGALLIASDGLYNEGDNPVYGPSRLKVPVYTIALGDTAIRKDLLIAKVNFNRMAFLGNSFPLEVVIDAHQCEGSHATLTILEDSLPVFSRPFDIARNNFHLTIPALLDAKKKGIHHYTINVSSLNDEVTYVNNVKDIFIEVVENKQKILILANAPHPDLGALKSSIENSPNYEVIIDNPSTFDGRFSDYNLVILHNLPGTNQSFAILKDKLNATGISVWYILGPSTNIASFNAESTGLSISQENGKINEVQALATPEFSLFSVSSTFRQEAGGWPPLKSPFGVYNTNSNIYPLLYQRLGNVNTRQPLFFFSEKEGKKTAVLAGEGIWRWRLADFFAHSNHELSDEFISKVIQYLSVKENRSPFRVQAKRNFSENEALIFDAELFNQSEQLVNEPEARIVISNNKGQQFPYTFTRTDKAYTLNTGLFAVGNYRYKASVKLGDKLYEYQAEFSVSALQLESSNTVADHQLLNTLAERSGASMYYPAQMDALLKALKVREDVKTVSFTHKKLEDLINAPWFFALLMLLISLEWFLRKRGGSY